MDAWGANSGVDDRYVVAGPVVVVRRYRSSLHTEKGYGREWG
jgi:hypothetical protein